MTKTIGPVEFVGNAEIVDGKLNIGGVEIPFRGSKGDGQEFPECFASIYVQRMNDDLSVAEIHIARHDGYAQLELDNQNKEAEEHPLGPEDYWRRKGYDA
ncbi:MAG: hypothetical protein NVS9B9_27190 [Ktedonobacteraceae bacterium]